MNATEQINSTKERLTAMVSKFGLALTCTPPVGKVDGDWPCIAYQCSLTRNGKAVWSGEYKLGVGHVKPSLVKYFDYSVPANISVFIQSWKRNPGANYKDKSLWAEAAAWLAKRQGVTPQILDVFNSLLMDGSAHFDSQDFEQWASDFGYDTDSRKAERMYNVCLETGRAVARAFSHEELHELRTAFAAY